MIIMIAEKHEKGSMNNSFTIKGEIEIDIIDAKSGELIETKKYTNLITNNGLKMHRNWAATITPLQDANYNVDTHITHIAVGDDNSMPAVTQTSMGNELLRKELYPTPDPGCEITLPTNNKVTYQILIDETELNGSVLREVSIFSESFTNFMISRLLCGNLTKSSSVQFKIRYSITYN